MTKTQIKKKKVDWLSTLIISILFGWTGVDRIIMGQLELGLIKLAITIISFGKLFWAWWIIDIILIATKYKFEGIEWVSNKKF